MSAGKKRSEHELRTSRKARTRRKRSRNLAPLTIPSPNLMEAEERHYEENYGRRYYEERLSALDSVSSKLSAAKSPEEIYELTLDAMESPLNFQRASFLIVDGDKLRFTYQRGYPDHTNFDLPLDGTKRGITVRAVRTRRAVLASDAAEDKDYSKGNPTLPPARSELAVPVISEGQVLGVLNVESEKPNAFEKEDLMLLEILASHAATAINNLRRRDDIQKRVDQQASLMKCSAKMIHTVDLRERLQAILDAVKGLGWGRVLISLVNADYEITEPEDVVASGLTEKERQYVWNHRSPGNVWKERLGPQFQRFKMGEFYYLPWSDSFVREKFSQGIVPSHLSQDQMVDWNPNDLLYAPLLLANGRIVGIMSIDDPADGKKPTKQSLEPLELFLYQAAVAIENAKLIQQLDRAKNQIQGYAEQLKTRVEEGTKELVKAQDELLKAQRLAAIGELASMVGHELRNPLAGIAGAAYYLKDKTKEKLNHKEMEMLGTIEKSVAYSNKVINDLLEYSGEIKLELSDVEPKSLVAEALSNIGVPPNVKVLDQTEKEPRVRVDKEKIRIVFGNIAKNAFDAMPKGGKLTVKTEMEGQNVVFTFSDTGTGMSKEVMNKIWSPLFTTKAKGMGLGLPVCKRIVDAHRGKISVESSAGKGSTIRVTLPAEAKTSDEHLQISVNMPEQLLKTTAPAPAGRDNLPFWRSLSHKHKKEQDTDHSDQH